jgi:hypothetical protein
MKTAAISPDPAKFQRSAEHSTFQRFNFQHFSSNQAPLFPRNPLFPASGPATSSFNGLHPKSKFLALSSSILRNALSFLQRWNLSGDKSFEEI